MNIKPIQIVNAGFNLFGYSDSEGFVGNHLGEPCYRVVGAYKVLPNKLHTRSVLNMNRHAMMNFHLLQLNNLEFVI